MDKEKLLSLIGINKGEEFGEMNAKDFERVIFDKLKIHGDVKKQVKVKNRGDGRSGRIDLVFTYGLDGEEYPIEIDRKEIRKKSLFKVRSYSERNSFVILRSPFDIKKV